jgi:hypothetical protein
MPPERQESNGFPCFAAVRHQFLQGGKRGLKGGFLTKRKTLIRRLAK